jgi:hypothetical protein
MLHQHVSKTLNGNQTISGTFKGIIRAQESNAAANYISQCVIRVFSGDMTTERGVLYGGNSNTGGTGEWNTSISGSSLVPTAVGALPDTALSSVNALDGDVVVVEIGYRSINTITTSYTGTAYALNPQNTTASPDYPSSHHASGTVPWIEFSQDLIFDGDYNLGDTSDVNAEVDLTGTLTLNSSLAAAGSADIDVSLDATLSVRLAAVGDLDAEVALEGTLSTAHPLVGDLDTDVSLDGTLFLATSLAGDLDASVEVDGDLTVTVDGVPLAGSMDVDVDAQATLYITTFLALSGDLDIDVDLYGDSFEESFRAGTMDVNVGLDGTIHFYVPAAQTLSTLTLGTLTGTVLGLTILPVRTTLVTTQTYLSGRVRAPLVLPPDPEPAAPGEIPVAEGVYIRALHGVLVDMATPVIEDGKPE